MFVLSTRTSLAARRTGVVAKASTGNWAPGTEKPKYLEGAPGYEELTGAFFFFFFFFRFSASPFPQSPRHGSCPRSSSTPAPLRIAC
jgi:hypothetical protein